VFNVIKFYFSCSFSIIPLLYCCATIYGKIKVFNGSATGARRHNENDVTMTIAGLLRYGDWRHVATGCTALVCIAQRKRNDTHMHIIASESITAAERFIRDAYNQAGERSDRVASNPRRPRLGGIQRVTRIRELKSPVPRR